MTYEITPRTLHFHEPAGTSRGTYTERRVWFVTLSEAGQKGTGECAPLPRLSCDDLPNYEEVLRGFCMQVCEKGEIDHDALLLQRRGAGGRTGFLGEARTELGRHLHPMM